MKVYPLHEDRGERGHSVVIPDEISKISNLKTKCKAVFGALTQIDEPGWCGSLCVTTKVEFPFALPDGRFGFFWYALPEHQGSHEFFPVLCGKWSPKQIKAIEDVWYEGEEYEGGYLDEEARPFDANRIFAHLGLSKV